MSPRSNTESYPAFARIGLRENPGKNLNQYGSDVTARSAVRAVVLGGREDELLDKLRRHPINCLLHEPRQSVMRLTSANNRHVSIFKTLTHTVSIYRRLDITSGRAYNLNYNELNLYSNFHRNRFSHYRVKSQLTEERSEPQSDTKKEVQLQYRIAMYLLQDTFSVSQTTHSTVPPPTIRFTTTLSTPLCGFPTELVYRVRSLEAWSSPLGLHAIIATGQREVKIDINGAGYTITENNEFSPGSVLPCAVLIVTPAYNCQTRIRIKWDVKCASNFQETSRDKYTKRWQKSDSMHHIAMPEFLSTDTDALEFHALDL
ncbi:hypothetical protein ANN_05644 [Periplaneta americana]|uniref:Uncharacterized protein n=1 Tax=Periplaneta americana TaxID=6978 RepID=A0ABQ8TDA1_PERAM|nr:hypothetical protein ANN_05644 [Periplaneta americana]